MQSPPPSARTAPESAAAASGPNEFVRIRALIQQQHHTQALTAASALADAMPDDRDALYLLAVCQRLLRRFSEALATLAVLEGQHPDYSLLQQERAYCLVNQGQIGPAMEAFSRAVTRNPALLASWLMLERLHRAAGDGVRAAQAGAQVAALQRLSQDVLRAASLYWDGDLAAADAALQRQGAADGSDSEALRYLARVRWRQGELDAAEALFSAFLLREANDREARRERARLNLERRDYPAALADIEVLRLEDPDSPFLRMLQAGAWAGLGDHEQAVSAYRALLESGSAQPEWQLLLGHSLKAAGHLPEAVAAYQRAAAARPGFGDAWWSLANLKTWRFAPEHVACMRADEQAAGTSTIDRLHLCFALGKALADAGDHAASWRYYLRGNHLRRAHSTYRPEITEDSVHRQMATCHRAFLETRRACGAPDMDPVFVVGLPRSGSTLIEQILASHSQVDGTQELPDVARIAVELGGGHADPLRSGYPETLIDLDPEQLRRLGERYLERTRVYRAGKPRFVDKMPNNFRHIGLIHLMLPNARIIDVRRDPMACCVANLRQLFAGGQDFSYDIADIARYYRSYLAMMRHWDQVLPGRVLRVRYEDLVENLDGEVRRLLDHCALAFEPACIEFHRTRRNVSTPSSEQVRRPIYRDGLHDWRAYEPWLDPLKQALGDALLDWRD